MKPARILVLILALAAGGFAAFLASRSDQEKPVPPAPPPVVQIETVDVLVARNDVGIGTLLSAENLRWQVWPTAAASANFIRRNDRPNAIEELSGLFLRESILAGEPIRETKLIRAKGSGYLAAILPEG